MLSADWLLKCIKDPELFKVNQADQKTEKKKHNLKQSEYKLQLIAMEH